MQSIILYPLHTIGKIIINKGRLNEKLKNYFKHMFEKIKTYNIIRVMVVNF